MRRFLSSPSGLRFSTDWKFQAPRSALLQLVSAVALLCCLGCAAVGSDCEDCVTVRQLAKEYEANSLRARQEYVGKRHDFSGTVENVENDYAVPPRPLIRMKSGGVRLVVRFDWGDDHSWVTDLNKGDQIMVNCVITNLRPTPFQNNKVIPFLDKCTRVRDPGILR